MKKVTVILIGIFLMTFAFTSVNAQNTTATTAGASNASILADITLTAANTLEFGAIASVASGGSVLVPTTGAVVPTTVTQPIATNLGQQGTFSVTGAPSTTYAISFPSATATLTNQSAGTETMTVGSFLCRPMNVGADQLTGLLSTGGLETLNIGATLTVNAGQAPGTYIGNYDVTVAYN